jgi:hypothetical protein
MPNWGRAPAQAKVQEWDPAGNEVGAECSAQIPRTAPQLRSLGVKK